MAITLKVTPEVLMRMAGDIERQLSDIEKQFGGIEREIRRTTSFWEGDASDRHRSLFDGLKEDIQTSLKNLKSDPENLLQMAGLYRETETTVTEASQALSADVIV